MEAGLTQAPGESDRRTNNHGMRAEGKDVSQPFAEAGFGVELTGPCSFWMTLSGEGRLPVMHFGMTGMVQVRLLSL